MINFWESFSNREIAFFTWCLIILLALLLYKPIRKPVGQVIKTFFDKKLVTIYLSFLAYIIFLVVLLQKWNFWEVSLTKDTMLWTFGFAFILLFRTPKMNQSKDFMNIFKDAVKWSIFIEFLVAFYSFSLITEFIILPVITFIALIQSAAEIKKEHRQVSKLMKGLLSFLGLLILAYVSYKTFFDSSQLVNLSNLKSFTLPIILTILLIPYLYIISLYSIYENLFSQLKNLIKESKQRRKFEFQILRVANLSINKISNISRNVAQEIIANKEVPYGKLKEISMKSTLDS